MKHESVATGKQFLQITLFTRKFEPQMVLKALEHSSSVIKVYKSDVYKFRFVVYKGI
jgi:hypothetical protein